MHCDEEKKKAVIDFSFPLPTPRKWPTLVALILLILAWASNEIALAVIHERVPERPPLPDVFFAFFPEVPNAIRITEYIMLLLLISALSIIGLHQHRLHVARRVFFCAALCYFFRAFCVSIVQIPVPSVNTYCGPKSDGSFSVVVSRVGAMFWSAGIEQLRPRVLCGDLIVSGHTITIFTALQTFRKYAPRQLRPLAPLYTVLACAALFCILLNRKHYSIDIVFGYFVATRTFAEYHSLSASFHDGTLRRNPLHAFVWARLVPFFEADAPPPHHFHNALQWPSQCLANLAARFRR